MTSKQRKFQRLPLALHLPNWSRQSCLPDPIVVHSPSMSTQPEYIRIKKEASLQIFWFFSDNRMYFDRVAFRTGHFLFNYMKPQSVSHGFSLLVCYFLHTIHNFIKLCLYLNDKYYFKWLNNWIILEYVIILLIFFSIFYLLLLTTDISGPRHFTVKQFVWFQCSPTFRHAPSTSRHTLFVWLTDKHRPSKVVHSVWTKIRITDHFINIVLYMINI